MEEKQDTTHVLIFRERSCTASSQGHCESVHLRSGGDVVFEANKIGSDKMYVCSRARAFVQASCVYEGIASSLEFILKVAVMANTFSESPM